MSEYTHSRSPLPSRPARHPMEAALAAYAQCTKVTYEASTEAMCRTLLLAVRADSGLAAEECARPISNFLKPLKRVLGSHLEFTAGECAPLPLPKP